MCAGSTGSATGSGACGGAPPAFGAPHCLIQLLASPGPGNSAFPRYGGTPPYSAPRPRRHCRPPAPADSCRYTGPADSADTSRRPGYSRTGLKTSPTPKRRAVAGISCINPKRALVGNGVGVVVALHLDHGMNQLGRQRMLRGDPRHGFIDAGRRRRAASRRDAWQSRRAEPPPSAATAARATAFGVTITLLTSFPLRGSGPHHAGDPLRRFRTSPPNAAPASQPRSHQFKTKAHAKCFRIVSRNDARISASSDVRRTLMLSFLCESRRGTCWQGAAVPGWAAIKPACPSAAARWPNRGRARSNRRPAARRWSGHSELAGCPASPISTRAKVPWAES